MVAVAGLIAGAHKLHASYATHQACESVRADGRSAGTVDVTGSGPLRITVIGDSYAAGDSLADRTDAWVNVFAAETDATVTVLAEGGTGFTNPGFCGDNAFGSRVDRVAATKPDLVIIEGGLNDVGASAEDEQTAVRSMLRGLDAFDIVMVGPVDVPAVTGEAKVDASLEEAASLAKVRYVSALRWDIDLGTDDKHPSARGHTEFARRLSAAIAG
ncbi:lysophospholipase L1-like esterase [Curtobacterium sp. PhB171]|nr:lysophospholipase L1-like esterase [Curtobacterium sp. PhB171]ROQ29114.1 lysophospholipase L1-like esterase [Curtobacterium sp. PhB170]ROS45742.1 lysophospholipase L1-like esterase [Curtobacterium sp. PhB131]ROS67956.1 lysophospholipase L1-like esterase [Curtobacterium sp. PhB141]